MLSRNMMRFFRIAHRAFSSYPLKSKEIAKNAGTESISSPIKIAENRSPKSKISPVENPNQNEKDRLNKEYPNIIDKKELQEILEEENIRRTFSVY